MDELAKDVHAQRGTNPEGPALPPPTDETQENRKPARVAAWLRGEPPDANEPAKPRPAWPPPRGARTCVATMRPSDEFGKRVAAEAYARNFFAAPRRAFRGAGPYYNWSIQPK
jgi:hypothetical protein